MQPDDASTPQPEPIVFVSAPPRPFANRLRAIWTLLNGGSVVYGVGVLRGAEICVPKNGFVADNVELAPGQHLEGAA